VGSIVSVSACTVRSHNTTTLALMLEADMQEPVSETAAYLLESVVEDEGRGSVSKFFRKTSLAIQLYSLYRKTRHYVDLLIDVHGHQIFLDGCFNGDPHVSRSMWVTLFSCCVYRFSSASSARQRTRAKQREARSH